MSMGDLAPLLALAQADLAWAGLLFVGTAALVAFCVPGVIVPMSVSATALLGGWAAVPVVTLGALVGSQALFLATRRLDAGRARSRLGPRVEVVERCFARYGLWAVVGLRLCGVPHFLVTAGSALLAIRASGFAAATLAGLLPVVALASAAGSLL